MRQCAPLHDVQAIEDHSAVNDLLSQPLSIEQSREMMHG